MKNRIYTVTLIGIIFDQMVKFLVKSNLGLLEKINIIPNFFSIYYVENSGAAFSMFRNFTYLLIIISILVLLFLLYYINKNENNFDLFSSISFGMILSGIVGNLIDRLLYGKVVDFLSFEFFNYNAPVFNLADTFIVVGVFIFIFDFFLEERREKNDSR